MSKNKCWICGGEFTAEILEKIGTPIQELGLSRRVQNTLKWGGVETVEELIKYDLKKLYLFRGMGDKSLLQIKEKIKEFGFDCWQEIGNVLKFTNAY